MHFGLIVCSTLIYPYSILQKKKERESAILKSQKLTEEQKKKWLSVTSQVMISSEESGEDDSIIVHPLPWRSAYVGRMFEKIDSFVRSRKSPQAIRQMKSRKTGSASSRPCPADIPSWALSASEST